MTQATALDEHRIEACSSVEGRLPYREHGCKVSAFAYGIHTISLSCRELDPRHVDGVFNGDTVDIETGQVVKCHPYRSCKQLRHQGCGLVATFKRTNTGHLLTFEGTASGLLAGSKDKDGLVLPQELPLVEKAVREWARRIGLQISSATPLMVHRADLASDVTTAPVTGLAILSGFCSLSLPARRAEIRTEIGSPAIESVTWSGSGNAYALRLYDRNAKATNKTKRLLGPRGGTLRLERQLRPKKRDQVGVAEFAERDLSKLYTQPFKGWLKQRTVIVSDYGIADALIQERARSDRMARGLLATFVRYSERGLDAWPDRRAALRHLSQLRQHGICPARLGDSSIPVGEILTAFADPWRPG